MKKMGAILALGLVPGALQADVVNNEPPPETFTAEQIESIAYPDLSEGYLAPDDKNAKKYFYFHRDGTGFEEAFADISECDALSSGRVYFSGGLDSAMASQMGGVLGGAIGGAIGSAIGDAIFGSAERRKIRRENMRACMGYKDYQRYALDKDVWSEFNFEEGNNKVPADERRQDLLVQAKVASGPAPTTEVLEP